jgi:hypothetical protein
MIRLSLLFRNNAEFDGSKGYCVMKTLILDDAQSRAQAALGNSPFYELRELQVEPRDDALSITGCVSSFYYKQLAQEAIRSVCSEVPLVNAICVMETQEDV